MYIVQCTYLLVHTVCTCYRAITKTVRFRFHIAYHIKIVYIMIVDQNLERVVLSCTNCVLLKVMFSMARVSD